MSNSTPFCCIPDAISTPDEARYRELCRKLLQARLHTEELDDGYRFHLGEESISLTEVAEWISYERRCCPFLTFNMEVMSEQGGLRLRLSGPRGAKDVVRAGLGF